MNDKVRWGIIGPGKIAHKFAQDLSLVGDAVLHAVSSRSLDRARDFGALYNAEKVYDSEKEMIADGKVDIVYIATPHTFHQEGTLLCLQNKIHVLCEKPAGINAQQVATMIDAAKQHKTFFLEALWTRFLPSMLKVLEIVESGEVGEVLEVEAEFCFTAPLDLNSRLYDLKLGGGSLLDIGIYPVFLSYLLLGNPVIQDASAQLSSTGSDQTCSLQFTYPPSKKTAFLHSSLLYDSQMPARINMSKGYILMQPRWHESSRITVLKAGEPALEIECPPVGRGYYHEIIECHNCLQRGKIESEMWSHKDSLNLITILDRIRDKVGVSYPGI